MDNSAQLVGTWKLISCFMEDIETKETRQVWGERPNGYLVVTSAGRWIVVQTAEDRKAPHTDEDQSDAFKTMLACSGKYRTEGNKISINIDIAWDEAWNGTEQIRHYRIEGNRLHIEVAPQPYSNFGGKVMRAVLIWVRG